MSSKASTSIPLSYATVSLGPPSTTSTIPLPQKLSALHLAGFNGIELGFPDLLAYACTLHNRDVSENDYDALRIAAAEVKKLCIAHSLKILMLQPFSNFEGWPRGSKEREDAFERAKGWISIMEACGTSMLQVGSSDTPLEKMAPSDSRPDSEQGRGPRAYIVADLRELADLLGAKGFRLAYENWCWSSHAPNWKDVWDIVRAVDRDNIGLCLDTFQSAGGEWGDPTTSSGRIEDTVTNEKELSQIFEASMAKLAATIPQEKIYLLQISDAYIPLDGEGRPRPLKKGVVDGTAPRGRWSHDYRPMPYDGGYLPIEAVGNAVLKTGFRGWFSVEIFDGGADGRGKEYELKEFAGRAKNAVEKFIERCLPA
ncbi:xylose isomerase-like protein [Aspergillus tetrazonus]